MRALALIAVAAVFTLAVGAHADPPAAPAASAAPSNPDPVLAFYPPAALAAGVAGKAVLSCGQTRYGGLTNCELVSEDPAGQGFGAAALALAAKSVETPSVGLVPGLMKPRKLTFAFTPSAPWIAPDVLEPGWSLITHPRWLRTPADDPNVWRAYPDEAARNRLAGSVRLLCVIAGDGVATSCQVEEETPPGHDFVHAATYIVSRYRMAPTTLDGAPVAGRLYEFPVSFIPPPLH